WSTSKTPSYTKSVSWQHHPEGFSPTELVSTTPAKKSAKRKAKYQYFENGVHKKWSGVGRVPVVIQQELDAGKPLESFLITTD
ncbi:H-NS family nucleoid-associated regulatory protein, partial [Klebsiella pneumoniae]|uniref:H-NS family nucleoid-associated regulatory protein n=1 Tax=Klebsiella pneumoniae TaxID=573 RepID=UPI0038504325